MNKIQKINFLNDPEGYFFIKIECKINLNYKNLWDELKNDENDIEKMKNP